MNRLFFNSELVTSIISGTAVTAALVIVQSAVASAKDATEIAAIAMATTVKIDNTLGIPGGSGVIIAKQDNVYTVLTADHVVQNPNVGYVVKINSQQYPVSKVTSLKKQTGLDLATVTFESPETHTVATFGDSKYATVGANVYVSGYPLAVDINAEREHEFTTGMITSIREGAAEGYSMRYQALTRRGMSGGSVFNSSGQLIGIHGQGDVIGSVKSETSSIPEPLKTGFNAAIPIKNFLEASRMAGIDNSNLVVEGGKPEREKIDTEATQKYIEGVELLQRGNIEAANDYLIEAEDENPNNVLAVYYQGLIDYTKRELNAAIAKYDRAIEIDPNFSLAYFSRGLANYRLGNKQQALEDYNSALRLNPADRWSYLNRGILREELNDISGAMSDYDRAIEIAPDYGKSYHNRGAVRYYKRDFQGAVADFKKASELFFQQGDTESYNVTIDSLNKAERALRNSQTYQQPPTNSSENYNSGQGQESSYPTNAYPSVPEIVPAENNLRDL